MTKLRSPLTPYRALSKIAELIGWDGCAVTVDKSESTMRKYADPDAEREITLRDAMRLDAAYRRAGGDGAPLFETYAARLEIELAALSETDCMIDAVRTAARESGEAIDAALSMSIGGNRIDVVRELSEAIEAFSNIKTRLLNTKS